MRKLVSFVGFAFIPACAATAPSAATPSSRAATHVTSAAVESPTASATSGLSTTARVTTPAEGRPDTEGCRRLAAEQDPGAKQLKRLMASLDLLDETRAIPDEAKNAFAQCSPTKDGAWGLVLRDVKSVPGGTAGRLLVVHVRSDGGKVEMALPDRARPTSPMAFVYTEAEQVTFEPPRAFDFDGDGQEELVIIGRTRAKNQLVQTFGYVVTRKGDTGSLYAGAANIDFFQVSDVDHDGRIDLLTHGPYRDTVKDACDGHPLVVKGPVLVAHSRPDGTFSMNDAAAIAQAKQACPEKPTAIVSRFEGSPEVDHVQTTLDVACARLWGQSAASVVSALQQGCRPLRAGEACEQSALETCTNPDMLRGWANKKPPVLLK